MTLAEMQESLAVVVQDKSLQPLFKRMINDAILETAADFDLPSLKLTTPATLAVITTDWIYNLPANYHKRLFKCADSEYWEIDIHHKVEDLDDRDLDHDETGDHVTDVVAEDTGVLKKLYVYPKAAETLYLWYFRKPLTLVNPGDSCDCIPPEFQERVLFPKIIIKNYQLLQDQVENFDVKPLQYWEGKLREGLYGSPQGPIGFINWIAKLRGGPKRHGGRDPIP